MNKMRFCFCKTHAFFWTRAYPILEISQGNKTIQQDRMYNRKNKIRENFMNSSAKVLQICKHFIKNWRRLLIHSGDWKKNNICILYMVRRFSFRWEQKEWKKKPYSKLEPIEIDIFKRWIHLKFHWQGTQLMEHMNAFFAHRFPVINY